MATVPSATTSVVDTPAAQAAGLDTICVIAPVATSADAVPRQYGNAAAIYAQHGYCEGVEYAAFHADETGKPILFVGIPIATAGVVGSSDDSGNTGTSVVTAAAGGSGCLTEHSGIVKVVTGGVVGTDQILLDLSLDDGLSYKRVRLGTATSYVIPYVGVTLSFAGGDLHADETVLTWKATGPRSNAAGWLLARTALAAQLRGFRSVILIGDLQTDTEALAYVAQLNAYETANERFIYGRAGVLDRVPLATMSSSVHRMTGSPNITFAEVGATGDTIVRSAGSWITDGFATGDIITWSGATLNVDTTCAAKATVTNATTITLDTDDVVSEGPIGSVVVTGQASLTFSASTDHIVRSSGSWLDDGFRNGDVVTITGTVSNNGTFTVDADPTASTLSFASGLADEVIGITSATIVKGQTKAAWMAAVDAEFATVDAQFRVDLSAGRGWKLSPFSAWNFRRPAAWAASIREYQHDLHIPTWRKSDGSTGWSLLDADQNTVEFDDRVDGGAGSAARFTTFRSWGNGPGGAFITQSLTRASDASLLSQTHNVAVTNLFCTTVQLATEEVVGRVLTLNDDGTATTDSLSTVTSEVNAALDLAIADRGEGQRASSAVWTPATTDILNVPNALLNGTLRLNLNGTIHDIATKVQIVSGGQ